jgi:hypothetical protein
MSPSTSTNKQTLKQVESPQGNSQSVFAVRDAQLSNSHLPLEESAVVRSVRQADPVLQLVVYVPSPLVLSSFRQKKERTNTWKQKKLNT